MHSNEVAVLVTGGAGYISNTCLELLQQGYNVVAVDNLVNDALEALDRIEETTNKEVSLFVAGLLDLSALKENIELTGSESEITFEELPKDDPQVRRPDISREKDVLGWEPKYDRKDGHLRTLKFFGTEVLSDE